MAKKKKKLPSDFYIAYDENITFEKRADDFIPHESFNAKVAHLEYIVFLNIYDYKKQTSLDCIILLLNKNLINEKNLKKVEETGMELSHDYKESYEIRRTTESPVLNFAIVYDLKHFETLDKSYNVRMVYDCKYTKTKIKYVSGYQEQQPPCYAYIKYIMANPDKKGLSTPSLNNNPDVSSKVECKSLSFGGHKGYFYPDYHSRKGKD